MTLEELLKRFDEHITPEVLAILLVDRLGELESAMRGADAANARRLAESARRLTSDFALAIEARGRHRVHPRLREILAGSGAGASPWALRAALLDHLFELGIADDSFRPDHFVRDPVQYSHRLASRLSQAVFRRVRARVRRNRRRAALAELYYLGEVAPGSPEVLHLLRAVKRGRRLVLARLAYAASVVVLVLLAISVAVMKLEKPQPLVIEPMNPETRSNAVPAAPGAIELRRAPASLPGQGNVTLDLDRDATAFFNGSPGQVRGHGNGAVVALASGRHLVTVVRPGHPPVMGQIQVRPGYSTVFRLKIGARGAEEPR